MSAHPAIRTMQALTGKARLAGVMGDPVGHSKSPLVHGYWLGKHGIDGAYVPLPVKAMDVATVLKTLPRMGFVGCNVTVPHKETVFELVDNRDAAAERIGAVNTVVFDAAGKALGRNTDGYGFLTNLVAGAPDWSADAGPATILGAGGAARAVAVALADAGVREIRLTNRTEAKAAALAEALAPVVAASLTVTPWQDRAAALDGSTLLVNTTSLGMVGQPPLDLDPAALPATAVVTDLVYAPLETPLLQAARARGLATVDGLGMLLHQAVPGFEAWFGVRPQVDADLRRAVLGP